MSTFALLWYAIMCTHRTLLYPHTYTLSSLFSQYIHHHAVTCDPCESPWTGRSWPVKPLNVFHMFLHMWGCAPYAPLSHSSLSHTIYWISNSDTMTSYNPSTPFFLHYWSSFWRCRLPAGLVLACNTYPCLTLSRRPNDHRQFSGVSPWEQSWLTTLRPYGFCSW